MVSTSQHGLVVSSGTAELIKSLSHLLLDAHVSLMVMVMVMEVIQVLKTSSVLKIFETDDLEILHFIKLFYNFNNNCF